MKKIEEEVKEMILDRHKSLRAFAGELGIAHTTLDSVFRRGFMNSGVSTVISICQALDIDADELANDRIVPKKCNEISLPHNIIPIKTATENVPVYGSIAAGVPLEMITADEHVGVPDMVKDKYPNAFFLKVNGDSMDKLIPNGAYAMIKPCEEANDSDVVAVTVNGSDATLKRLHKFPNGIMLMPESNNETHNKMMFDCSKGECDEVRILGKLVWFMPPFNTKF